MVRRQWQQRLKQWWAAQGHPVARRGVAWVIVLSLVGCGTLDGLTATSWASQRVIGASGATDQGQMFSLRGQVVAIRGDGEMAVRVMSSGGHHLVVVWLRLMPDSHVSMAHLRRHLREHAPTDVLVRPGVHRGDLPQVVSAD